jgi:hypothetical protein
MTTQIPATVQFSALVLALIAVFAAATPLVDTAARILG